MQFLTFQYTSRDEALADFRFLWERCKVTGELSLRSERDVTFLEVVAERDLPASVLEKLKGVRL
jgi:hypothetical protein